MKWTISIFFLLTMFSVSGQQVTSNDSLAAAVTITRNSYSIVCPGTWKVDTSGMIGTNLILLSPLTGADDSFSENINVFIQDLTGQGYTLDRMGKESEAQIGNIMTNLQIIESRLDSSKATPYYVIRYKGQQGKYHLSGEQRYFFKKNIGYAVTFTVLQGREDDYQEISRLILDSFVLL